MAGKDDPRLQVNVSNSEHERRWKAVREAMKTAGLDFLVMQNCTDFLGGYVKWFADVTAQNNYPVTVLFPRADDITIIKHGPRGTKKSAAFGIKKEIGVPALPSLDYGATYQAEALVAELAPYKNCHIGLVGMSHLPVDFYSYLTKQLATAKFETASDLVDNIKAIKSDEEIEHLRRIAQAQDETFKYALTITKPGRRNFEIRADLMHQCLKTGSDQANLAVNSSPPGQTPKTPGLDQRNRVIQDGDQVDFRIESCGPSGYFAEIVRSACLGKVSSQLQEQFELSKELQQLTLGMLKPGAEPIALWEANNEFLRKAGYPEERRLLFHGMGYDMVERPCVQPGETMKIQLGMNLATHARVSSDKAACSVCENVVVTQTGPELLHKAAQKIFVI